MRKVKVPIGGKKLQREKAKQEKRDDNTVLLQVSLDSLQRPGERIFNRLGRQSQRNSYLVDLHIGFTPQPVDLLSLGRQPGNSFPKKAGRFFKTSVFLSRIGGQKVRQVIESFIRLFPHSPPPKPLITFIMNNAKYLAFRAQHLRQLLPAYPDKQKDILYDILYGRLHSYDSPDHGTHFRNILVEQFPERLFIIFSR